MSLDVYLSGPTEVRTKPATIYIRENGATRAISAEEWQQRFPGTAPCVVDESESTDELYHANITHNLGRMADACGLYRHLWRPDELGIKTARELIEPLREGLARLTADPERFSAFNPSNGWGTYDGLVKFVREYLEACIANPDAVVTVSR